MSNTGRKRDLEDSVSKFIPTSSICTVLAVLAANWMVPTYIKSGFSSPGSLTQMSISSGYTVMKSAGGIHNQIYLIPKFIFFLLQTSQSQAPGSLQMKQEVIMRTAEKELRKMRMGRCYNLDG